MKCTNQQQVYLFSRRNFKQRDMQVMLILVCENIKKLYLSLFPSQLSFSPDEHFKNVLKMLQFHARTNHNLLAAPVNRTAWVTTPAVVNAYYSRSKNMIGERVRGSESESERVHEKT